MTAPADAPPLQLADLWPMVQRRRTVAACTALAAALLVFLLPTLVSPPLYRAEATLSMDRNLKPVSFQNDPAAGQLPDQLVNTQRELLTSKDVLGAALAMGGLPANPVYAATSDPVGLLQRRLRTTVIRNSWVIAVSLDDEDPVRAESGLQSVLDAFLAHQATQGRRRHAQDLDFLKAQLVEPTRKLQLARDAERVFREQNAIASVDPDRNHITSRIQTLAERQAILDERVAASGALFKQVQAADAIEDRQQRLSAYLRIDTISTVTVVGALQKSLFELLGQEAELSAKYLEKHPRLIEVRSHIAAKRAQLEETIAAARAAIEADYTNVREQRAALIQAQSDLQRELDTYRERLVALQRLVLESQAQQRVHDELLARQAQLMALAGYDERRMVVDGRPSSSPLPRGMGLLPQLALAFLAAAAGGVVGAALADSLDRTVRDRRQLRQFTGLRELGAIPLPSSLPPVHRTGPGEPPEVAEAMRSLWTGLRYILGAEEGCRLVVVASACPGDGRSTVAARLAVGAAMAGSRVLLVDGDLRQPAQAAQLGIVRPDGLAQLLAGEPDIAPSVTTIPNLALLPSGAIPANPGELLNSHCLAEWLAQSRGHFDLIIVDSPALAACSDALILGGHADLVLVLARSGHTQLTTLHDALHGLEPLRAKLVCALVEPSLDETAAAG